MKLLIGSDIHVNENKRLDDTIAALAQILGAAEDIKPDVAIFLGDIFDKRRPSPKEMQVINKWLVNLIQVVPRIILLEGNHDQDNGVSSLSYIKDLNIKNIDVVVPPIVFPSSEHPVFYFGHEQIDGAFVNNVALKGGKTVSDLLEKVPACKVFAFGHFHKPQVLNGNPLVFYAGSITKTNFSERDDQKILWYFEDSKLIKTIPLATRPMFQFDIEVIVEDKEASKPWDNQNLTGALIKIIYSGTKEALNQVNEDGVRALMAEQNIKELHLKYNVTDSSKPRNESLTESVSNEVALREFFAGKDLDEELKSSIIEKGLELIKEVDNG